ncbi:MAG: helix-hairpin-helix domain-containing protein, partial [Ghiorsea sp.]
MISQQAVAYLRLSLVPGVGVVTARQLLEAFGSIQAIWQQTPHEWLGVDGVGPKLVAALTTALGDHGRSMLDATLATCNQANIHIICPEDDV